MLPSIVSRDIPDFDDVECGMWTGIPTTKVTFLVQIKSILFTSNQVNLKLNIRETGEFVEIGHNPTDDITVWAVGDIRGRHDHVLASHSASVE